MTRTAPFVPDFRISERRAFARGRRVGLRLSALCAFLAALMFLAFHDLVMPVVLGIVAVIVPFGVGAQLRRTVSGVVADPKNAKAIGPRSFWFDENRLGWDAESGVYSSMPWSFVNAWSEEEGTIALDLPGPQLALVRVEAFDGDGAERFRDLLRRATG